MAPAVRPTRIHALDDPGPDDVAVACEDFLDQLPGPTLVRIRGRARDRRRVVTALLHGNEPSGLRAVHAYLRSGQQPAVDALVFLGAVEAARAQPRHSQRMLPDRRDLNRCFRPPYVGVDGEIAEEALERLTAESFEGAVDLHNNTGHNPAYGLGRQLDGVRLGLCALFAMRYVHTHLRLGTVVEVLDEIAPSITVECGRAGDPAADSTAEAGLRRFLEEDRIEPVVVGPEPITILVDPVRVRVRPGVSLAFSAQIRPKVALTLDLAIDRHNFQVLPAGTRLGWVHPGHAWPLEATDASSADVSRELFALEAGELVTKRSVVPIMMTTDPAAVAADCLCYLVRLR